MCVNQSNTQKGIVLIRIGLWNLSLKDLKVDQKMIRHQLLQTKPALNQTILVIAKLTRTGRCGRVIRGGRGSRGGKKNASSHVP